MYHSLWNASCVFLAIGILMLLAGSLMRAMSESHERYKGRAEAKVVDLIFEPMDDDRQTEYRNSQIAVFEFVADGKLIKVRERREMYPSRFSMNQKINIRYNIDKPEQYKIENPTSMDRTGQAIHIAGIAFVLIGCVCFFLYAIRFK